MFQAPSIGRIVHCLTRKPDGSFLSQAAIVTFVYDEDTVDLTVFARASSAVPLTSVKKAGTEDPRSTPYSWDWPLRN